MLAATSTAAQVVFEVNDTGDDIDANVLDGKCETPLLFRNGLEPT